MNRRGFLGSILALASAPAIVRADSLMRIIPVETSILSVADVGLTEEKLKAAIRAAWEAGGTADVLRVSPAAKRVIEGWFSGAATRFYEEPTIPTESIYVSDYACSRIVMDRQMSGEAFTVGAA